MDDLQILQGSEHDEQLAIVKLIEKYRIGAAETFAEKEYLLERDGIGFSPRGNVCAIAAEKKAGKTWFAMAMCAAVIKGDYLDMKSRIKNAKVLFFDTEQDAGDSQRIQRRVHFANGWDFETDHDEFQIFHLREIKASERRSFIKEAIEFLTPDFVIVDGIRDLLSDFNDLKESADVIQEHMELSSKTKCCIWDVLHVNPNSEKMRGHLGTELGNKVADIIHLTKKKDANDEDNVTYKAEETDSRGHKDIHSIVFRIDDNAPYGMPVVVGKDEVQKMETDELTKLDADIKACEFRANGKSWTELEKDLKNAGFGRNERHRMIKQATQVGILYKADNGRYYYAEGHKIPKNTDLPF